MLNKIRPLLTAFCLGFYASAVCAHQLECQVVGVSDGDTLTALCGDDRLNPMRQLKIRLAEIDAPEKTQPFGRAAKMSLAHTCFGKLAVVDIHGQDRYGRSVAHVNCAGIDAHRQQLERGLAWVYDKYVLDKSLYLLQHQAQEAGLGLWADKAPIPPWQWRQQHKHRPRAAVLLSQQ